MLKLTSSAPVNLFNLSTQITGAAASDFAVVGGSCMTIKKLKPNVPCKYDLIYKAKKKFLGGVSANLEITAMFAPGVCPAGDVENINLTLSGNTKENNSH